MKAVKIATADETAAGRPPRPAHRCVATRAHRRPRTAELPDRAGGPGERPERPRASCCHRASRPSDPAAMRVIELQIVDEGSRRSASRSSSSRSAGPAVRNAVSIAALLSAHRAAAHPDRGQIAVGDFRAQSLGRPLGQGRAAQEPQQPTGTACGCGFPYRRPNGVRIGLGRHEERGPETALPEPGHRDVDLPEAGGPLVPPVTAAASSPSRRSGAARRARESVGFMREDLCRRDGENVAAETLIQATAAPRELEPIVRPRNRCVPCGGVRRGQHRSSSAHS